MKESGKKTDPDGRQAGRPTVEIENFQGRDVNLTQNMLVAPGSVPNRIQSRVKKFIRHYLGTAEVPIPFGGRAREIELMNAWLVSADGPSRMLVTAGAGRGKTALLIRWLHQLKTDLPIVFMPVSIRFGTSQPKVFYEALAGRLADVVGAELSRTGGDSVEFYKEKIVEFFDLIDQNAIPCLVVIDGLDEATGWEFRADLLPDYRIESLKVLVSARIMAGDTGDEGWRLRLGWQWDDDDAEGLGVPPLDVAAIGDILAKTDQALVPLAELPEVLKSLARLTDGDPLLLSYFITDLQRQQGQSVDRITRALQERAAGFGAYFSNWIAEQQDLDAARGDQIDDRITSILAIMASSLGPILFRDLVDLVARVHPINAIITTDTMDKIGRFILGDGVESGFALGHPKLREYLRRDFFGESHVISQSDQGFIDWGREKILAVEARELQHDAVPEYLLSHYAQHLIGTGASARDLALLTSNAWRRAWLASSDGDGFRGLKADAEAALAECVCRATSSRCDEPVDVVTCAARCVLAEGIIDSLGLNVPPILVALALSRGRISSGQALQFIRRKDISDEAEATAIILPYLDPARRQSAEEEILAALARPMNPDWLELALEALIPALDPEFYPNVIALAVHVESPRVVSLLAQYAPESLHDELLTAISELGEKRPEASATLVTVLDETRRLRLLEAVRSTGSAEEEVAVLLAIAETAPPDDRRVQIDAAAAGLSRLVMSRFREKSLRALWRLAPNHQVIAASLEASVREIEADINTSPGRLQVLAPLMSNAQLQRGLRTETRGAILAGFDIGYGNMEPSTIIDAISDFAKRLMRGTQPGDELRHRLSESFVATVRLVGASEAEDSDSPVQLDHLDEIIEAIQAALDKLADWDGSRAGSDVRGSILFHRVDQSDPHDGSVRLLKERADVRTASTFRLSPPEGTTRVDALLRWASTPLEAGNEHADLSRMVPQFADGSWDQSIDDALQERLRPPHSPQLALCLSSIVPHLPDPEVTRMFDLALRLLKQDRDCQEVLIALVPRLSGSHRRVLFGLAEEWQDVGAHLAVLTAVQEAVPKEDLTTRLTELLPGCVAGVFFETDSRIKDLLKGLLDGKTALAFCQAAEARASKPTAERTEFDQWIDVIALALPHLPENKILTAVRALLEPLSNLSFHADTWNRLFRVLPEDLLPETVPFIVRAGFERRPEDLLLTLVLERAPGFAADLEKLMADDPPRFAGLRDTAEHRRVAGLGDAANTYLDEMSMDEALGQLTSLSGDRWGRPPDWFEQMVRLASDAELDRIIDVIMDFDWQVTRLNFAVATLKTRPDRRRIDLLKVLRARLKEYDTYSGPLSGSDICEILLENEKLSIINNMKNDNLTIFEFVNDEALNVMSESGWLREGAVRRALVRQNFRPEDRWGILETGNVGITNADQIDELYDDLPKDLRQLIRASFHVSSVTQLSFALQISKISSAVKGWSADNALKDLETEKELQRVAAELLMELPKVRDGVIREDCLIAILPFVKDVRDRVATSAVESIVDDRSRIRARLAVVRRAPVEDRADLLRAALEEFDNVRDWVLRDELLSVAPIEMLPELLAARLVGTPEVADELLKRGTIGVARRCLEMVAASRQDTIEDRLRFHIMVCDHFDLFGPTEDTVRRISIMVGSTQGDIYAEMPRFVDMLNSAGMPDAAQAIAASVVDLASWWRE